MRMMLQTNAGRLGVQGSGGSPAHSSAKQPSSCLKRVLVQEAQTLTHQAGQVKPVSLEGIPVEAANQTQAVEGQEVLHLVLAGRVGVQVAVIVAGLRNPQCLLL